MFCQCVFLVQLYRPIPLGVRGSIPRLIVGSRLQDKLCSSLAISSRSGFNDLFKPLSNTYLHLQAPGQPLMTLRTPRSRESLLDQLQSIHVNRL